MLQVFKAGKHTDSRGITREYSDRDVQDIADSYDPKVYQAPIFASHDESTDNQGLIQGLKKVGSNLFAIPHRVANAFKEKVNSGRLPAVSVRLYHPNDPTNPRQGKWGLRHLAIVQILAIKGMEQPSFAESDKFEVVIEFAEVKFMEEENYGAGTLARNLREYLIQKEGVEVADRVIPGALVDDLIADNAEEENEGESMSYTEQVRDLEAREAALKVREAEIVNIEKQTLEANYTEFLNSSAVVAKVPVAEKPYLLATMKALGTTTDKVEFAEGESLTPLAAFKKSILSRPDLVSFGEFAKDDASDRTPTIEFAIIGRVVWRFTPI